MEVSVWSFILMRSARHRNAAFGVWLVAGLGLACQTDPISYQGKVCVTAVDCPQPLSCVYVRPGGQPTCEMMRLPGLYQPKPAEPTDFCSGAKPVLDTFCNNCHGAVPTQNAPATMRFDVYQDVGSVLGAKSMEARIELRTAGGTMPPPGSPQPSAAESAVLTAWHQSGAPECFDAGVPGETPDAGAPDGG